jgi:hypothetical protein
VSKKLKFEFPIRKISGREWCALDFVGIKKLEIASYRADLRNPKFSFAGGHRHRLTVVENDIHLCFPEDTGDVVDISAVMPAASPKRRHSK